MDQNQPTLLSGSTVILTGGFTSGSPTASTQVLGTPCQDFPLPVARSNHVAVNTGSDQLVCGGHPAANYKSCLKFNYISKTWEDHSTLLQYRYDSSAVTVHDKTYIFGGRGSDSKTSEYLTVGQNTWTVGPDIPGNGVYLSCVVSVDDRIVIIGGTYNYTQVIVYDVTTDQWTDWPSLTDGVYDHDCILTPQGVLVTGGRTGGDRSEFTARTVLIDSSTGHQQTVGPLTTPRHTIRWWLLERQFWPWEGTMMVMACLLLLTSGFRRTNPGSGLICLSMWAELTLKFSLSRSQPQFFVTELFCTAWCCTQSTTQ